MNRPLLLITEVHISQIFVPPGPQIGHGIRIGDGNMQLKIHLLQGKGEVWRAYLNGVIRLSIITNHYCHSFCSRYSTLSAKTD